MLLVIFLITSNIVSQNINIFFDHNIPQFEFAANEIKIALKNKGFQSTLRPLKQISSYNTSDKIVLTLHSNKALLDQLHKEGPNLNVINKLSEQAYALRTLKDNYLSYWVVGGDVAGAMYGGLQIAENIAFNALDGVYNEEASPYLKKRGIKFNIALDNKSHSFDSDGDQDKSNIKDVWDITFWKSYLDDLARYRYNTLSFWTKHPFTCMIALEEYPDVVIHDVTDGYGNLVKKMTIEEKIAFWQEVMTYAKNRSIDIFYFTWNIFLSTAEGKYGITHKGTNENTKVYLRKSVEKFLLTYPHISGIGVTAGERMRDLNFDEREKWLWDTYVQGIMDAKKQQPNREIRFIHRHWNTACSDIMNHFKDYDGAFEFSFKYARAHMYSSPNIVFEDFLLEEMPEGTKSWWNVRNDDMFYLRWGDPEFTRDFLLGFDKEKTAGYLMGSDGYTWGRVYSSKKPLFQGKTEISKHWYNFMLWGRLGYNPQLSQDVFKIHLKQRFKTSTIDNLYKAWKTASKIIPQTTRFAWRDWDGNWYPEGCKSGKFLTVKDFMVGFTMEGSGILNIADYCQKVMNKEKISDITPFDVANNLENYSGTALDLINTVKAKDESELQLVKNDIIAFAHLGNYYSEKIRGATELALYANTQEKSHQKNAVNHLEKALIHWKLYAQVLDEQYLPKVLARTGKMDWNALTADVKQDIEIAKDFKGFDVNISFENIKDGNVYPVGTDLTVNLVIESNIEIETVGFVLNGEYLGVKKNAPFLWNANNTASLKNMNTGSYELKAWVKDNTGFRIDKIINIEVK
ncbi:hypothetical protein [Seonamhaeicola marinus]|uniref:Carbohydrate-binding family 6 protein n=1 Tax=Seonamhaeicola marinus TaxID=1912246 RepID=A0A5D0HJ42_9FLAO|nr:hypothetical protein [Seonamhaeicola marinus]TYA70077.1 hypothetical protein FUA24_22600 [Seonamhaeicola marinus]